MASSLDNQDINWERVFKRLLIRARFLTSGQPRLFDSVDANDLVSETLVSYFASPTALGWDRTIGSIETFLMGVLKNKLRVHLQKSRRFERASGEITETYSRPFIEDSQGEVLAELRNRTKGDKELTEIIDAVAQIDESKRDVNRQLAEVLEITTAEVVNRKKRLARILRDVEGVQ